MRITSRGQVTIPADIRARAGLLPHTEVEVVYDGSAVRIRRPQLARPRPTQQQVEDYLTSLADLPPLKMSADEFMAMIRGDDE